MGRDVRMAVTVMDHRKVIRKFNVNFVAPPKKGKNARGVKGWTVIVQKLNSINLSLIPRIIVKWSHIQSSAGGRYSQDGSETESEA